MAKTKFNLADYIPDAAPAVSESDTGARLIPIKALRANALNFYDINRIDELADSIELSGLLHPLTVIERGGEYVIVSGHRRYRALRTLYERSGCAKWAEVPCTVVPDPHDPVREKLMLIQANSTGRVLSGAEIARQARELTECLTALREQGVELPGRLRDAVAEAMQISASKLARVQAIENNLRVPGLRAAWEEEKLNESVAYELSQLTHEQQYKALDRIIDSRKSYESLTAGDVRKLRRSIENHEATLPDIRLWAERNGIALAGEDVSPVWVELMSRTALPGTLRWQDCSRREDAIGALRRRVGSGGHYGGAVDYQGRGSQGFTIVAPLRRDFTWEQTYDLCVLALLRNAPVSESDTDDEDDAPPPETRPAVSESDTPRWHRCFVDEPEDGATVLLLVPDNPSAPDVCRYYDGQFCFLDDPDEALDVKSCYWWLPLPTLPKGDQ